MYEAHVDELIRRVDEASKPNRPNRKTRRILESVSKKVRHIIETADLDEDQIEEDIFALRDELLSKAAEVDGAEEFRRDVISYLRARGKTEKTAEFWHVLEAVHELSGSTFITALYAIVDAAWGLVTPIIQTIVAAVVTAMAAAIGWSLGGTGIVMAIVFLIVFAMLGGFSKVGDVVNKYIRSPVRFAISRFFWKWMDTYRKTSYHEFDESINETYGKIDRSPFHIIAKHSQTPAFSGDSSYELTYIKSLKDGRKAFKELREIEADWLATNEKNRIAESEGKDRFYLPKLYPEKFNPDLDYEWIEIRNNDTYFGGRAPEDDMVQFEPNSFRAERRRWKEEHFDKTNHDIDPHELSFIDEYDPENPD